MSDQLDGAAQEWYRKAAEAMNRQNWDYAIECLGNATKMKPDVVLYRQTKHGCIRKKYDDNETGARMAGVKLMGIKTKIKKARSKQDWKALDELAEEGLLVNPWDAQLNADLGEAAMQRECGEIAQYALSMAVKYDEKNIAYNKALGQVLRDRGEYKAARRCYERVYKLDPTDGEARSMMSQMDAEATMDRGGYEKAENTQDVKAEVRVNAYEEDRQARRGGKKAADAPGESAELDLQHAIRKEPDNVHNYLKLAELYKEERKLPQAIAQFEKAIEVGGEDVNITELREDVELDIMRQKLAEAAERAHKNKENERLQEKAVALKQQLQDREIEVLAPRVARHPENMRLKYELAERYRKRRELSKAIPLYQQAASDSRLKEEALVWLGECFLKDNKIDLGRRQFERALETLTHHERPDSFLRAHYWLGRVYEKASKVEQAETHYSEILAVDYDYKDVLKRLEGLQTGDGGFDD